jgi:hypothetical protein
MTKDDIIRMAREAGMRKTFVCAKPDDCPDDDNCCHKQVPEGLHGRPEVIEQFAALVAAAEREACVKVCDDLKNIDPEWKNKHYWNIAVDRCSHNIRLRGNHD